MMNATYRLAMLAVAGGFFTGAAASMAGDDITSYATPKGHPPISQSGAAMCPVQGVKKNAAPIRWTTPAGWNPLQATAIRIGNFLIPGENGKKAEVAITSFPGTVGTELDNVNRWRDEIGLESVDQGGISSEGVSVDSFQGKLYDFAGASASTVVVSVPREGVTWFFKMRGDKDVVDGAKATFRDFLKSVHFTGATGEETAATLDAATPDPHAGRPAAADRSNAEPKWTPPSAWKENPSSPMIVKSFSVSGENGRKANIAISEFDGAVGGTFANVNRWRAQLGLGPIDQKDLPEATQALPGAGSGAVLVDLTNPSAPAGAPARLVAAIVPQGDRTWFYKLVGDATVVAREKDGFMRFVQTTRYP